MPHKKKTRTKKSLRAERAQKLLHKDNKGEVRKIVNRSPIGAIFNTERGGRSDDAAVRKVAGKPGAFTTKKGGKIHNAHSKAGKAILKKGAKRKAPKLMNKNTRKLMGQVDGMMTPKNPVGKKKR